MELNVNKTNFHHVLKDIENIFWFFLLSMRTLSDSDIQNILRTKNNTQEGYATFNDMLDKFNKATNLTTNGASTKLNISNEMFFIGKAMAITTYEYLLASNYKKDIQGGIEFKFLRHIRNGAAHNNKFHLKNYKDEWTIGVDEVVEWDSLKISRKLQGEPVFNSFVSIFGIFLLAKHFSDKLGLIDKERNETKTV